MILICLPVYHRLLVLCILIYFIFILRWGKKKNTNLGGESFREISVGANLKYEANLGNNF